jgi:hypothetical protein
MLQLMSVTLDNITKNVLQFRSEHTDNSDTCSDFKMMILVKITFRLRNKLL